MDKECAECGQLFKVKPSHLEKRRTCSRRCRAAFLSKNPEPYQHLSNKKSIPCSYCGKVVTRKLSHIKGDRVFCNKQCRGSHASAHKEEYNYNRKQINAICKFCGNQFSIPENRRKTAKFCSRACLGKANGDRAKVALRKRVKVACMYCGSIIDKKPSVVRKWNFCNEQCMGKYYEESGAFAGENNGAWLGGDESYYGPNWMSQRRKARKRDNNKCCDCGITEEENGQELSVHHITRFKQFNGDWKKANRLSNLVSLCEPCHRKRHKTEAFSIQLKLF